MHFFKLINYFWLHWVFVAACGLFFSCSAWASHCGGFSCCGARAVGARASVVAARGLSSCGTWALECRLSSCGTRAQLLRGMWDLPGPGLEPMSPALTGGFLTTVPLGKPLAYIFMCLLFSKISLPSDSLECSCGTEN